MARKAKNLKEQLENNIHRWLVGQKSWQYQGLLEYEYDYGPEHGICDCKNDCCCRCQVYKNIEIIPDSVNLSVISRNLSNNIDDSILEYAIDRIVRLAKINERSFEVTTEKGYYGEEIGGVYLETDICKKIADHLRKIVDFNDEERIKYILTLEYGFLLDCLEKPLDVKKIKIPVSSISLKNDNYYRKISEVPAYGTEWKLPRCIVYSENAEQFRVIDGYHRLFMAQKLNLKELDVVCLTPR